MPSLVAWLRGNSPGSGPPGSFGPACWIAALLGVLLAAPWLFVFHRPAGGGLDVTGHQIGRDFINIWAAPQLAFGGKIATLFDFAAYRAAIGELFGQPLPIHAWSYPIFDLILFWPFAQLPYFWSLAIWTVATFAALAAVTLSAVAPRQRMAALLLLALAPACLINAAGGQNGFLSAALLLGGISQIDRRPVLAGVLFGLLTFKPHLGVAIPFALLVLRAWQVIGVATLTALTLIAGSLVLFGLEPWRQYFEAIAPLQMSLLGKYSGFYTLMMTSVAAAVRAAGPGLPAALGVQAAVAVPVLLTACWAVHRTGDPHLRAAILVCATLLLTPYAFNYDLTALAAVLIWMMYRPEAFGAVRWGAGGPVLLGLGWLVPILAVYFSLIGIGLTPLVLVAILIVAVAAASRATAAPPTTP